VRELLTEMTQFEDGEFEWGLWSVKSLDEAKSEGLVEVERWIGS
jgi:hypothetical protein